MVTNVGTDIAVRISITRVIAAALHVRSLAVSTLACHGSLGPGTCASASTSTNGDSSDKDNVSETCMSESVSLSPVTELVQGVSNGV